MKNLPRDNFFRNHFTAFPSSFFLLLFPFSFLLGTECEFVMGNLFLNGSAQHLQMWYIASLPFETFH